MTFISQGYNKSHGALRASAVTLWVWKVHHIKN